MNPFPAAVKARLRASGSGAAVSLLEVQTVSGSSYYWSDADNITTVAALGIWTLTPHVGGAGTWGLNYPVVTFKPWLLSAGPFKSCSNTTTSTGQVTVQNISGDTVRRDVSQIFSKQAMAGALVFYRMWLADCEFATFSFKGSVNDAEVEADGETMTLQLVSLANWAALDAPYADIGVSCPLSFGSVECGSSNVTPCDQSYGSCTSTERFKGVLVEWTGATLNPNQYVQPAPLRVANSRVAS